MLEVCDRPIFTQIVDSIHDFVPESGSSYLYGTSVEERSAHSPDWEQRASAVQFIPVVRQGTLDLDIEVSGAVVTLPLRALSKLTAQADQLSDIIYLDITGLAHNVWAPLVRAILAARKTLRVVYVEPSEYRRSSAPTEGELFALTERIAGISPIPGFASLLRSDDNFVFVPLLGFEGTRLAYILEQVQPVGDKVVPIVGVPGFRPEYPFHSYLGNRAPLEATHAWRNLHYARANCPFSAYYILEEIAREWPDGAMKIAPIGTKPHALGAILFSLLSARPVELVYDHPIRRNQRTKGSARACIYHVSSLAFSSSKLMGIQ